MVARIFLFIFVAVFWSALSSAAAEEGNETAPAPAMATVAAAAPKKDRIWSGVVIASNAEHPAPPAQEVAEFVPRLKRVFGYNQFELFGGAANEIDNLTESWLVPSKTFWLCVKSRRAASKETRGGYLLDVQLFYNKRPILDTEAKLAPGSPLFIRGPQYGKGQVLIVLQIQR